MHMTKAGFASWCGRNTANIGGKTTIGWKEQGGCWLRRSGSCRVASCAEIMQVNAGAAIGQAVYSVRPLPVPCILCVLCLRAFSTHLLRRILGCQCRVFCVSCVSVPCLSHCCVIQWAAAHNRDGAVYSACPVSVCHALLTCCVVFWAAASAVSKSVSGGFTHTR